MADELDRLALMAAGPLRVVVCVEASVDGSWVLDLGFG
jgi:hypothetical protein